MILANPRSTISPAPETRAPDRAGVRPATDRLRWAAAALALALALAGCGRTSADTPQLSGTPAPSGVPTSADAAPAPSAASPSGETPTPGTTSRTATPRRSTSNVTLVRSGGFAGLTETITVQPDGRWKRGNGRTTERTGRLSTTQASRLQALVTDPHLEAEADRPPSGTNTCNDTFTYVLTVDRRLIKYEECPGQSEPPKVTMEIVSLLQDATSG